jgi:DNA-directed RNA polymerase specialized sigma24 family protein
MHQWAQWARGTEYLGLPSKTLLARWMEQGAGATQRGKPSDIMPDDVAEIDAAVCKLPKPLQTVCKRHYLDSGDLPSKAKRLRISRTNFKNRLESALRRIAYHLGF